MLGFKDYYFIVLVIWPYAKAANAAASVHVFPWMGPKSITGFILILRSFTCRLNHDMGLIFYLRTDARPTCRFQQTSNPRSQVYDSNHQSFLPPKESILDQEELNTSLHSSTTPSHLVEFLSALLIGLSRSESY